MLMRTSKTFRSITENQDKRVQYNSLYDCGQNLGLKAVTVGNQKHLKTDHMALSIIIPSKGPKRLKVTSFTMEASK